MKRFASIGWVVGLLAATPALADTPVPPPSSWLLLQNDPDPFCPGATSINFAAPQPAEVELVVLSLDGASVLRTLVNEALQAGFFTVIWDGKGAGGSDLADGTYPYRLTARDSVGTIVFQDVRAATLLCTVPASTAAWSTIKARYR